LIGNRLAVIVLLPSGAAAIGERGISRARPDELVCMAETRLRGLVRPNLIKGLVVSIAMADKLLSVSASAGSVPRVSSEGTWRRLGQVEL
jgi:hypothetical protein